MAIQRLSTSFGSWQDAARVIATYFNQSIDGRSNAIGSVTLTASTTTTTVTDTRVAEDSTIALMPVTANAAAESCFFTVTAGQFVNNHPKNAPTDRDIRYAQNR